MADTCSGSIPTLRHRTARVSIAAINGTLQAGHRTCRHRSHTTSRCSHWHSGWHGHGDSHTTSLSMPVGSTGSHGPGNLEQQHAGLTRKTQTDGQTCGACSAVAPSSNSGATPLASPAPPSCCSPPHPRQPTPNPSSLRAPHPSGPNPRFGGQGRGVRTCGGARCSGARRP
eukprot:1284340-Rhodomonas_salina.1